MARLEVGRVVKPHGLAGELVVRPSSNRPGRFDVGSVVFAGEVRLVIETARAHGDRLLLRFAGVGDRDAAEALRGATLAAEPPPESEDDELWVHQVVGALVVDVVGNALGRVSAVEANPAHDLLVLDQGGLVPVVFVVSHQPGDPGRIVVDVPPGLIEVTAGEAASARSRRPPRRGRTGRRSEGGT